MFKLFKITIVCFVLFLPLLSKSQDVRLLIQERMSKTNQFDQRGVSFNQDSLSKGAIEYLEGLKDIKELDDLVLDLISNDMEQFMRDTSETNRLLHENKRISEELEQKKGLFFYSLATGVVATSLFLIFMVLYMNARFRMRRAFDIVTVEKQITAKYQTEMEEMKHQMLRNSGTDVSKDEYLKMKELCDSELKQMHEVLKERESELSKAKRTAEESQDSFRLMQDKYVSSEKEVEELSDALANLSQVSKHKIEEMEINFMKIEKLAKLREINAISEEEFQSKKNILMSEI